MVLLQPGRACEVVVRHRLAEQVHVVTARWYDSGPQSTTIAREHPSWRGHRYGGDTVMVGTPLITKRVSLECGPATRLSGTALTSPTAGPSRHSTGSVSASTLLLTEHRCGRAITEYRMLANPYQAPPEEPIVIARRRRRWLLLLLWCYPMAMLGAFYVTWLAAWVTLGHMPRPSLDDPKGIGLLVDIPYWIVGLMLMGCPAAGVSGVVLQLAASGLPWSRRFLLALLLVCLWMAVIAVLRWDPLSVVVWYFD
jgi:hypothetical protein